LNCKSAPVEEVRYIPSKTFGCSNYIGKERINCINGLLSELEGIKNSDPVVKILSRERKNDKIVIVKKEICHSQLCFNIEQEIYDPSFWYEIKYVLTISIPSIGLGIILVSL
jgi:hypothetical protein